MQPAPSPADENHRWAALHALRLPDSEHDQAFASLARCAADLTGCPVATISVLDDRHEWFKATQGLGPIPTRGLPQEQSFCRFVADGFEFTDTALDARAAGHPWVAGPPGLRFCAGEPLRRDGRVLGALCVADVQPRRLDAAQRQALQQLAKVVSDLLHGRERWRSLDDERNRLLDFARASGDWMWETDAELRYTWLSGAFEAITGVPPDAMKGRPIADSPLLDALGQPRDGGMTFHGLLQRREPVTRVITDKPTVRGTLRVSRSAVPVFDARGGFAGYRGTARDVTAHIESERQIHGQAELLRKLSSQVPGVIFQFWLRPDASVTYSYASDASHELFGALPPRNDDGGDRTAVCRMLHPEDAESFMPSLVDAAEALRPWQREYRVVRPDGGVRWLEVRAVPEPHPDGGTLWHGFTADVTTQKEIELVLRSSEERWSMAAAAAGIGIAQFQLDGELHEARIHFDARACLNHGLPHPHADYRVRDWLQAIHPEDRARVDMHLGETLRTGGTLDTRFRVQRSGSETATLEVFARCAPDATGRVHSLVGTCRDVTQQAAHEQLRHDKEAAERASRAKSEFLSRVSHELRTPLNGILGFAQLMAIDRVNPLAPDQGRRLKSVLRAGRHLLELINDMLNLARIEQEDFSLQQMPVNLNAMVDTCYGLIQPLAENAGVQLRAPATGPRHWALADTRAVEQVLLNLLSNAIKYNRRGGSVEVTLSQRGGQVVVAVRDEGEGLSPEQQAHLFQPFNRLGAEQRRVEGTGLGLVIARELAASMKGELQVQSTLDVGSTFSLLLPAGHAPTVDEAAESGFGPPPLLPEPTLRRVLYIEDEPLNVMLLQEVFKSRPQWVLEVAADGRTGLASVRARHHDLLLIDMNLPDMNGLDLIRQLRADPHTQDRQCIALSADAMQSQIHAAMSAGFDGYWTKPINVTHILQSLENVLVDEPPSR